MKVTVLVKALLIKFEDYRSNDKITLNLLSDINSKKLKRWWEIVKKNWSYYNCSLIFFCLEIYNCLPFQITSTFASIILDIHIFIFIKTSNFKINYEIHLLNSIQLRKLIKDRLTVKLFIFLCNILQTLFSVA